MNDNAQSTGTPLDDGARLAAIRVSGSDRIAFLQGQFTQDLTKLNPEMPVLAGWNSPKGRLYFVSWLADWQDAVWLVVPRGLAEGIVRRLRMFVLRAAVRVEISNLTVQPMIATSLKDSSTANCFYDDNSLGIAVPGGSWQIGTAVPGADTDEWRLANIRAGVPCIWPATSEAFVPQMVNLDLLGGISFSKGCYVGQEIVARTQNLGRIKRRMFRFTCAAAGIEPGATVSAGDQASGTVVDAVTAAGKTELLAVVRLEKLAAELTVAGMPLQRAELQYLIPEDA